MKKYWLLAAGLFWIFGAVAQTLTSSNLPIIIINTHGQEILDDPKITADMGIINNAPGIRNNVTDPFNQYNGKIGIELRGQSTQMFPMKAYGIELRDAAGNSQDKSLFGLPKESDWVLYAPYNEKTLMHNFLAYTMSREMGHWSANCRYVEVIVNGDYRGIYVFMEKIKRNSGRVNIPKLATTDVDGDAVTGGYIFSIDKDADGWFSAFKPGLGNQQIQFSYVYPKVTALVPQQANYIKNYTDSFEKALFAGNYQDPQNGWRRFADENSFLDYFIVNEISHNVDGYRLSSYFYKDRDSKGGKITAGPVWDYDLAFRNANYCSGSDSTGWAWQFNGVCPDDFWQVPFWWNRFLNDTAFTAHLRCRWKQLRQTTLSQSHFEHLIDSISTLTAEARGRHFVRWPVLGVYVWPNPAPIAADYEGEIRTLKTWLSARLSWIDRNLPNVGACSDYPAGVSASIIPSIYPNPSQSAYTLRVQSKEAQSLLLKIFNTSGQLMTTRQFDLQKGFNYYTLDASRWQAGAYFLHLQSGLGDKALEKLLKE